MTLFDECRMALSEYFYLLDKKEEEMVLKELYKYPFEFGTLNWKSPYIKELALADILQLISEKKVSKEVYVVADVADIPLFKTKLDLILNNMDDVSAISMKVFLVNKYYIATFTSTLSEIRFGMLI